jgi:hypothetical protein
MSAWNKEACLSQVAVESNLHEDPHPFPTPVWPTRAGGSSESECIKIAAVYKWSARNPQVECKIIGAIMSTACVQQSTGSLQCLPVECSEQLVDNKG